MTELPLGARATSISCSLAFWSREALTAVQPASSIAPFRVLPRPVAPSVPGRPGGTVVLLHPPLHSVGVSMWMERGCQQNDSLAGGCFQSDIVHSCTCRVMIYGQSAGGASVAIQVLSTLSSRRVE